jgi:hypothetical protein
MAVAASRFNRLTAAELAAEFIRIAIRQGDDLLGGNTRSYNRLFDRMRAIELELKARPGDQRSELQPLLTHPNIAVRWRASVAILGIAPTPARQVLEAVAKSGYLPICGHAGMTLHGFDTGFFKPT